MDDVIAQLAQCVMVIRLQRGKHLVNDLKNVLYDDVLHAPQGVEWVFKRCFEPRSHHALAVSGTALAGILPLLSHVVVIRQLFALFDVPARADPDLAVFSCIVAIGIAAVVDEPRVPAGRAVDVPLLAQCKNVKLALALLKNVPSPAFFARNLLS